MAKSHPTVSREDGVVPSARAERPRMFGDDSAGITIYVVIVLVVVAAILGVVILS